VFESVKPKIAAALAEAAQSGVRDNHALSQIVRRTIGRWVNTSLRRKPMIIPLVIEA
jgi:ribonuclease J